MSVSPPAQLKRWGPVGTTKGLLSTLRSLPCSSWCQIIRTLAAAITTKPCAAIHLASSRRLLRSNERRTLDYEMLAISTLSSSSCGRFRKLLRQPGELVWLSASSTLNRLAYAITGPGPQGRKPWKRKLDETPGRKRYIE